MIQRFDIQYISIWIHISISYISIFYIYISALYTIDVEIESARHPQVCPRNCFNTFPLTRPKDGPLPSGSQSCLENARGWFLVFDFHSKPGKWWPLPGYMEFHPPIYKYIDTHIYIFGTMAIKAMYSRNFPLPCLIAEGISMWKMLTATGNLQGLQLQEDWSPRWCRQPLNAAALNTVMGSKKTRMNQTPVYELAVVVLVYISPFCVDRSNGRWFAGNQ